MRGGGAGGGNNAGGEIGRQTSEGKAWWRLQRPEGVREGSGGMRIDVVSEVPLDNTHSPFISFLLTCIGIQLMLNYSLLSTSHRYCACLVMVKMFSTLWERCYRGNKGKNANNKRKGLQPGALRHTRSDSGRCNVNDLSWMNSEGPERSELNQSDREMVRVLWVGYSHNDVVSQGNKNLFRSFFWQGLDGAWHGD